MKNQLVKNSILAIFFLSSFYACKNDDSSVLEEEIEDEIVEETTGELHKAFEEFDADEVTIYLEGSNVVVESTGYPNHTTPYYEDNHPLYVAPTVTSENNMTPTKLREGNSSYAASVTVPQTPTKASNSTETSLGSVGIAVSGAYIFNDNEGSGPLDNAAASLDYTGGHIGPGVYHYHLEPKAFSNDDDKLIGIIADGFFIYGRKCNSTGTYPTDLDGSGGHTHATQHSDGKDEYHYHVINELYSTTGSYILFAGPYIGSPNAIN